MLRWRRSVPLRWSLAPDASAAIGLLAASLIFYYPLVFLGRVLVDYDAFVYFYPQRMFLARSLLEGRIPLWDPDLFLGAPFLANPQTAVLYPPSWLFVLGPVQAVCSAGLVLHAFLAAFFTYLLVRHAFGVLPLAAAVGGLAYAFGGFAVGQVGHLNQISAAAWLPAVLLAYDRFARSQKVYWLALGALALAMELLAGHPQETYMTLIVLGIFGVVGAPWRRPRKLVWCAIGGAGMCALGGGLSAAQLMPTLELAPLSIRGEGVNWRDAVAGSLPSYLAVRALLPPYWINVPYTEYLGYAGVTPVALGLLAIMGGRGRPVLVGFLVSLLAVFLALGMLVAMTGTELWAAAEASPARQAPPPAFTQGETVDWLRAHGVTDQERLLSLARPEYVPAAEDEVRAGLTSLPEPVVESVLVAQKWHDTLTPNVPLQYGLNTADGYDGGVLPLLRWLHLSGTLVQSPRPDGVLLTRLDSLPPDRQLDLLGVRYLVANAETPGRPDLQMVDFGDLRLFARPNPVPLSLVVFGATRAADEAA